jgi:hypothetical protein
MPGKEEITLKTKKKINLIINKIAKFIETESNKIIKIKTSNKQFLLQQESNIISNEMVLSIKILVKANPIPLLLVDFFGLKLLKLSKNLLKSATKAGTFVVISKTGTKIKISHLINREALEMREIMLCKLLTNVKIVNYIICAIIINAIPIHSETDTFNLNKFTDVVIKI